MNQEEQGNIICKHCGDVSDTRGKYNHHYRTHHQNEMKIRSQGGQDVIVVRSEDEKFVCICGQDYLVYQSISRHQKDCKTWKDHEADGNTDSHSQGNSIANFNYRN